MVAQGIRLPLSSFEPGFRRAMFGHIWPGRNDHFGKEPSCNDWNYGSVVGPRVFAKSAENPGTTR